MSETRDIGFLKWSDPLAWMEPMKGERWKTTLRSEERRFDKACNDLAISSEMEKIIKELQRATSLEKPESSHFGKIEFSLNLLDQIGILHVLAFGAIHVWWFRRILVCYQ